MAEAVDKADGVESRIDSRVQPLGLGDCVKVILDRGRRICIDSNGRAIVIEDQVIDYGPEWRVSRDAEKGVNRIRASGRYSYRYHDASTATTSLVRRDGTRLPRGISNNPVARIIMKGRKAPQLIDRSEAREVRVFDMLKQASAILGLESDESAVVETASLILHRVKPFPRREIEARALVAMALIKALEIHQIPMSSEEVRRALGLEGDQYNKYLWKALKIINEKNGLRGLMTSKRPNEKRSNIGCASLLPRIDTFIHRAVVRLNLPTWLEERASRLLRDVLEVGGKSLCGHKPEAVAAAIVYIASRLYGFEVNQKSVAKALGIRDTTLRKQQKFLVNGVVLLIELG